MTHLFDFRSYQARLVAGVFALILLTTLSAGVPAYWLTRAESERQAWSHVAGAEQATHSLLLAEQDRLDNLLALFSERPTLHRLLRSEIQTDLDTYLRAFQRQSALDLLILCAGEDAPTPTPAPQSAAPVGPCPQPPRRGFDLYESRPALLSSRTVLTPTANAPPVVAVAGKWLDGAFLRRLAADTGVTQSILLPDGRRIASTLNLPPGTGNDTDDGSSPSAADTALLVSGPGERRLLDAGGNRYYTRLVPLQNGDGNVTLLVEVALPVNDLFAARNRALTVLAVSTGIVALVGMALGAWAVRRISDPLDQLTRTAEAISAGDLDTPIPSLAGPQEVRTLASALQRSQASMLAALDHLAQTRDWLENLVQSLVEGVVIFDDAGRVTFLNEKAADLAATTVQEGAGRDVDELFSAADESGKRISLRQLGEPPGRGGRHRIQLVNPSDATTRPLRRAGQPILRRLGATQVSSAPTAMLEVTVTRLAAPEVLVTRQAHDAPMPRPAPSEQPMQTVLILRDVSQEESLRHLRSYFLANITHEFRTPLSALAASMELLTNEADLSAAEMRELLKPLHLSLLSLQTLIENLLESSSIEAGRFVLRRREVNFHQVIADAVRVVRPLLERKQQTLSLHLPHMGEHDHAIHGQRTENSGLRLSGDPARLTQVLVNLLSNAGKYSPAGSEITLDVEPHGNRLRVAVADRGPGIPKPERQLLFRRFVRLNGRATEQYGIGLGLHVVKTTVEAHGGEVGVDEQPGGGSIFWFELPTDPPSGGPDQSV